MPTLFVRCKPQTAIFANIYIYMQMSICKYTCSYAIAAGALTIVSHAGRRN